MRLAALVQLSAMLLTLAACDAKPTASPVPSATASASASAPVAKARSSSAPMYRDEDLAVGADYEDAAEKQIDKKNYRQELEKIEAQVAPPKGNEADRKTPR